MTHFEVHKFTDDRWLLDAVYDDQGTAIEDARSLMARARALAAVRVLKVEEHDEGFVEWIVYTRDPTQAQPPINGPRFAPRITPLGRRSRRFRGARGLVRSRAWRSSSSPVLALAVAVALGGLLTIVFQRLEPREQWLFNRPEAQQPRAIANPWTGETSR
jgi:hypothetical protein